MDFSSDNAYRDERDEERDEMTDANLKTRETGWDMDTTLVFREVRGLESITLSENCETIHIALDDWTLRHLLRQGKPTGNTTVITLTWDRLVRRDGHFYMCEIGLQDECKDLFSKILTGLCDRNFTVLRELTTKFFQNFQTKVTRVKYPPLSIELAYFRSDGFEKLRSQLGDIEDILKTICSACAQTDLSLSVCLHVSDESNRDDDMDGIEFTMSLYGSGSESEDNASVTLPEVKVGSLTYVHGNESIVHLEGGGNRLSRIESELQSQRETFSARFDEQESHNENQQQILQSLADSLKLLLEMESDTAVEKPVDVENLQRSSQLTDFDMAVRTNCSGSPEQTEVADKTDVLAEKDKEPEDISESDNSPRQLIPQTNYIVDGKSKPGNSFLTIPSIPQSVQDSDPYQETGIKMKETRKSDSQFVKLSSQPDPGDSSKSMVMGRVEFSPHSTNPIPPTDRNLPMTSEVMHALKQTRQYSSLTETSHETMIKKTHSEPETVPQPSVSVNRGNRTEMQLLDKERSTPTALKTNQEWDSKDNNMEERSHDCNAKKPDQQSQGRLPKQTATINSKSADNSREEPQLVSAILQGSTGGRARHFLANHGVRGTTAGVRRMVETVETAMKDDDGKPPTTKCLNTVLCLDTSDALCEEGFMKMKKSAVDFLDGIEDIAARHEIEENVAVVSFGGKSQIAHHLSNDYSSVRVAVENLQFGGKASLFEALLVSLCSIKGRGGPVTLGGTRIQPRIIVMTAGHTVDDIEEPGLDEYTVINNSKERVIKLVEEFGAKVNESTFPRPIIWIPFNDSYKNFLEYLSKMENSRLVDCEDVKHLCKYQRQQVIVGTVFNTIKSKLMEHDESEIDEDGIRVVVRDVARDLETTEMEEIISNVEEKLLDAPSLNQVNPWTMASDFRNIIEYKDKSLPRLGSRVIRGLDWTGGSEDSQGPGTVINHTDRAGEERKKIWVLWDNGVCQKYRFGYNNAFDLEVVHDHPRITPSAMIIEIGCEVTRGCDWSRKYNDQDGGAGAAGVVIRKTNYGKVIVRWRRNAHINEYRYGKDNKLDLQIRDPLECLMAYAAQQQDPHTEEVKMTVEGKDKIPETEHRWVWQWLSDSGDWQLYSEEMNEKLEKEYHKRQDGSCIVQKDGKNFRVLFKSNIEKKIDGSSKTKVQRICL